MIDRRTVLSGSAAVAVTATLGMGGARAARRRFIQVGDIKITPFSDGHLNLPARMLAPGVDDAARTAALKAAGQKGTTIVSPLNVTLIETPSEKILIDVGSGPRFMATAGKLTEGLEAAGVDPEKITKVIYTHAHPDHLWGTVNDFDELSFPNA
ncbi:MAG: MBL fold metallo-hydrolase, partial [Hyphomicrobiaceae bacterium]